MIGICTWWFLLGDTRVVCECDLNSLGVGAEKLGKYAKWHSDKTAKTGFVGFGLVTWVLSGFITWGATVYNLFNIVSAGIWYLPITTGISGSVRSVNGAGQWRKRRHRIPTIWRS